MRLLHQAILLSLALPVAAQNRAESSAPQADAIVDRAQRELERISELVKSGELPPIRLEQAAEDLADAQDEAVLSRTLNVDVPAQNLNEQMAADMIAAARRRVERQQRRLSDSEKSTDGSVTSAASTILREELYLRKLTLDHAMARLQLVQEIANLARFEQSVLRRPTLGPGVERFDGSGQFLEADDLPPLQAAFQKKFNRPLPISADGETAVHRALGFDHRGRVDVAVNPEAEDGVWLRHYLRSRGLPYYAFTHAVVGSATGAHVHIGPGSLRSSR